MNLTNLKIWPTQTLHKKDHSYCCNTAQVAKVSISTDIYTNHIDLCGIYHKNLLYGKATIAIASPFTFSNLTNDF
jgi:hypothetical protein